ncbi:MAG: UDP-N-acetylmuramate dehydrogenase [Campylobacter sp.]|nr:UDP-N-acetylmuramate dehydrogenase [Campylobacter sp.]
MTKTINFAKFSSVKIGGEFEVYIIDSVDSDFDGVVIGGANNLLLSPNPPKMAMLGKNFDYIKFDNDVLEIGAATKSAKIYNFAKQNDLANFEFLKNIPGTLGGLIKMNAGLCGLSISDSLIDVRLKSGWVNKEKLNFTYRKSEIYETIFAARFQISKGFSKERADEFTQKRANQPKGASFGSCFVNPQGNFAGKLIEDAGLKDYAIGGAKFSEQHANFLINFNNASFDDAISLIKLAQKEVFEKFGVELKTEVVVL